MKKLLFSILGILNILIGYSQEIPTKTKLNDVDEIIDELLEEQSFNDLLVSLTNLQFLYISVNYNSDTYFSGREIDIDQFNLSPQISYMHSKGFYASVSSTIYSEFEPNWDVTTGTIGYGKSFGKGKIFRYSGSFSGYLYSNNNVEGLYKGSANVGIGIQNIKRTIGTQLSGSYYFGSESTYQIVSRSYVSLNLLKAKKVNLKFRPQLNFITGTQLVDIGASSQIDLLDLESDPSAINLASNSYSLINTQLNFPIRCNINSFDLEIGYNVNFPSAIKGETDLNNTNFFNLGVSYLIDL